MFNILPIILNFIQTRKFILHYEVSELLDFGLVLDRIFMSKVQDQVNRIVLNTKQVHVICTKYMQQVDKCMIMQYFYSLDFTFPSLQHLTKVLLKQFRIQILGCTYVICEMLKKHLTQNSTLKKYTQCSILISFLMSLLVKEYYIAKLIRRHYGPYNERTYIFCNPDLVAPNRIQAN